MRQHDRVTCRCSEAIVEPGVCDECLALPPREPSSGPPMDLACMTAILRKAYHDARATTSVYWRIT